MGRSNAAFAAAATLGLAVTFAPAAGAYCRTTTCDAVDSNADCMRDAQGCSTVGSPLFWKSNCVSFSVQADGSPKRGITVDTLNEIVSRGFDQWEQASCGGGRTPSIVMFDLNETEGPALCNEPEYNKRGANANVWLFRDDNWPYVGAGSTLALTTVTFAKSSGEILDADVEVNSAIIPDFTTEDAAIGTDLPSVVTHEAGHFLGLAHSGAEDATMYKTYPPHSDSFRSLAADDQQAICRVYPPDRTDHECIEAVPVGGYTPTCGGEPTLVATPLSQDEEDAAAGCNCALGSTGADDDGRWGALAALAALAFGSRRRSRR